MSTNQKIENLKREQKALQQIVKNGKKIEWGYAYDTQGFPYETQLLKETPEAKKAAKRLLAIRREMTALNNQLRFPKE